jgi:ABC-2 type transport system ATP-binding protein
MMRDAGNVVVEVVDLVKRYPKSPVSAVDGVSFAVERGEVFGLLGPNGAGKTTTIGILTTRVRPTGGTAREREERANALLHEFGLDERADEKIDLFSGGQMQRAMIARALMHSPEVLFLDEPSTGLDPAARLFLWDRIRELRSKGVPIVLTTHDLDEANELSDRVGIMDHGHLLALDTPEALTKGLPGSSTLEVTVSTKHADDAQLVEKLARLPGVERGEILDASGTWVARPSAPAGGDTPVVHDCRVRLYLTGDATTLLAPVARLVDEEGGALTDLKIATPSLEDVFISLTGRSLR